MNAASFVATLTGLTTRLADLLAAENELLRTRRPAELTQRHEEKTRLASAYERQLAAARREPALLQAADPAQLTALKEVTARFRTLLQEHGRRLIATKGITERLVKNITEEAIQRRRQVEGYDRKATLRPAFGAGKDPVSLALNQVI